MTTMPSTSDLWSGFSCPAIGSLYRLAVQMSASWVAIDFETATSDRASACAIGLVVVENGTVIDEHDLLIQPPDNKYDDFNISIHGITPADTANQPTFKEIWPQIENIIDDRLVIAHNTGFDFSVIRQSLTEFGIEPLGTMTYGCTRTLSHRCWNSLPSYSLPFLCNEIGIDLDDHHNALTDARACSELALRILEQIGVTSIEEAAAELKINLGRLSSDTDIRCLARSTKRPVIFPDANENADPNHPFFGREVCFTGTLDALGLTRSEAAQKVAELGGIVKKEITNKTSYLITGTQDPARLCGKPMSGKLLKASARAAKGQEIEILTQYEFMQFIYE